MNETMVVLPLIHKNEIIPVWDELQQIDGDMEFFTGESGDIVRIDGIVEVFYIIKQKLSHNKESHNWTCKYSIKPPT